MSLLYTFPYQTCEAPSTRFFAVQPYSALVNMGICGYLVQSAFRSRHLTTRLVFVLYALFELFHAFSHAYHLAQPPQLQFWIIHLLNYANSLATLLWIREMSKRSIRWKLSAALFVADLAVVFFVGGVWTILSGFSVFLAIVLDNFYTLPRPFRSATRRLVPGLAVLCVCFVLESCYCDRLMSWSVLPYHIFIELTGAFLFFTLGQQVVQWDHV